MDISQLLPPSPLVGPPLPKILDPYLPWNGDWPWYKAPSGETTPGGSDFGITIYDQSGNVIAQSGLSSLPITQATEGDTISAGIKMTNNSYQTIAGAKVPIAATLNIQFKAATPGATLVSQQSKSFSLAAGESINIGPGDWGALGFTLPVGTGGSTATVTATLTDTSGNVLNTATASFGIAVAPITYGGSISFN